MRYAARRIPPRRRLRAARGGGAVSLAAERSGARGDPEATPIAVPVIRSIARSTLRSEASQSEIATPLAPARAVRPMRWT